MRRHMTYKEGKGRLRSHARIPDMDHDGIDAAFLYPSIGLSFEGRGSAARACVIPCLQPLVGGLLQALSGPLLLAMLPLLLSS